jgi:hypothetical protein
MRSRGDTILGKMPLPELLGEAQHRIRVCNAGATPAPRRSWHPLCHQATQFFLENSDDVGLPDQAKQSRVIPGTLARLMHDGNATSRSVIILTCQPG